MKKSFPALLIIFAVLFISASQIFYVVDQREQAILLQLGQPVGDIKGPGLHTKIPFVQDVRFFDSRMLSVDPAPDQVVISNQTYTLPTPPKEGEKKETAIIQDVSGEPIIVDTFARYKIVDPLQFLKTLGSVTNANRRLESILTDATRSVLGNTTLAQLLSSQRTRVMGEIQTRVNLAIEKDKLGIQLVDVRIVRADLTAQLLTSTVRRMISELKERATETRSKGEETALQISSEAEKQRTVILANAQRDAQITRGTGDETAIKIYTDAFNKDKDFYAFFRSMEAYQKTLADSDTRLILSPDSGFLRYLENIQGR